MLEWRLDACTLLWDSWWAILQGRGLQLLFPMHYNIFSLTRKIRIAAFMTTNVPCIALFCLPLNNKGFLDGNAWGTIL